MHGSSPRWRVGSPLLALALMGLPRLAAAAPPAAPEPTTVRLGFFSTSLPVLAAERKGFWASEGIAVATTQVKSSLEMYQKINAGAFDVGLSSADNPVNYRFNPHNAVGSAMDVQIIFGTDWGLDLSLVAREGFKTVESLRGQALALDALDSGYAYVLYKIMRIHGMERDKDYQVVKVGGTPLRLAGLLEGKFAATLLNADSVVRARAAGLNVLAGTTDVANPYLGGVGVARQSWLAANAGVADRFIRGYARGQAWATDPKNREEAIGILATLPRTPRPLAEKIYDSLRGPLGLIEGAEFSRQGLMSVLKLRAEFGGFETPQDLEALASPASALIDPRALAPGRGAGKRP